MKIVLPEKYLNINSRILAAAALIAVVATATAIYVLTGEDRPVIIRPAASQTLNKLKIVEEAAIEASEKPGEYTPQPLMRVYISGCVKQSGVVSLKKGSIIDDAIKAAGGPAPGADLENINLAYELNDNDMIRIPSKASGSSDNGVKNQKGPVPGNINGAPVVKDSGGAVPGEAPGSPGNLININTASAEQLDTLPYIGVETAKDIISYREKNGGFKTIEDIMKVPGIKESRFNKLRDRITVD